MSDGPRRPLVFQCIECNTIIGDSLSLVLTDEDLQAVIVDYVRDVVNKKTEIETAEASARDCMTTFRTLSCSSCQASLGRFYITPPPSLPILQERYAIDIQAISSYELGAPGDTAPNDVFPSDRNATSRIDQLERRLRDEITKVQGVILSLHERLQALENDNTSSTRSRSRRR